MSTTLTEPNPPSVAPRSELEGICRDLERLRGRHKTLCAFHGLSRFGLELGGFLVVAFLADRLFVTPKEARLVQLAVVAIAAVVRFYQLVAYPVSRPIRLRDIAVAVENRYPVLDGRLISALELGRTSDLEGRNLSGSLVKKLVDDAVDLSAKVPFGGIFKYESLRRHAGALLGLAVAIAIFGVLSPIQARVFFDRFLGGSTPWPRKTHLSIQIPKDSPNYTIETLDQGDGVLHQRVLIARGASLPVLVRAFGRVPEDVSMVVDTDSAGRREYSMRRRNEDEFFFRLRSVRHQGQIRVRGGDDGGEGRLVEIAVRTPPTLTDLQARLTPPVYTGLAPSDQSNGHIDAPMGTKVDLSLAFNVPIQTARLAFDGREDLSRDLPVGQDPSVRTASFVVEGSGSYTLDLIGEDGFPNLDPITFNIVAIRDKEPVLQVLDPPRPKIDVTPTAVVLFRGDAEDDYGIAQLLLSHRMLGNEEPVELELTGDQLSAPLPATRVRGKVLWDLRQQEMPDANRLLEPGDSLGYRWVAIDNALTPDGTPAPSVVSTPERRIEVVSEAEKLRLMTERQVRLKSDTERVRRDQIEARTVLRTLIEVSNDEEYDPADLVRIEVDQNQITQRALRLTAEFADMFEEYLFNRLDKSSPAERLLQAHLVAKAVAENVDGYDAALFQPRLDEYSRGDYGEMHVLSKLLFMLDLISRVSQTDSPEAYDFLSRARVTIESSDRPDLLDNAVATQDRIVSVLDELLQRMDEWEDFQEVLELMRDIVDDTKRIGDRYSEELKKGQDGK